MIYPAVTPLLPHTVMHIYWHRVRTYWCLLVTEPAMWACSPESRLCPGLHQKECNQQVEDDSPPLLGSGERPTLQSWVQLWGPQHKRDMDLLEQDQRRATEMLEHFSWEDRLKELCLFSIEKRRLQEDLTAASSAKGGLQELWRGTFHKGL